MRDCGACWETKTQLAFVRAPLVKSPAILWLQLRIPGQLCTCSWYKAPTSGLLWQPGCEETFYTPLYCLGNTNSLCRYSSFRINPCVTKNSEKRRQGKSPLRIRQIWRVGSYLARHRLFEGDFSLSPNSLWRIQDRPDFLLNYMILLKDINCKSATHLEKPIQGIIKTQTKLQVSWQGWAIQTSNVPRLWCKLCVCQQVITCKTA